MPDRNRVRVESNERIDKPDFEALQLGAHLAVRYALRGLMLGTDAADETMVLSTWTLSGVGSELTITPGRALAGEEMADGSIEHGYVTGEDGDASQVIDFVGEPAATYIIYVRPDFSAGVSGSRLFWNSATLAEDPGTIDTREVSGWRAVAATSSPGTGYTPVGRAVWNGAAFTSVHNQGKHFWEGVLGSLGEETAGGSWGDGANDRDNDRATYGVQGLFKALSLVRRQLKDIIGAADGHWGSAVPVNLTDTKVHVDLTTDPHGSAPTWTGMPNFDGGIDVNGHGDFRGAGYVEVDTPEDVRFAAEDGSYFLPVAGMHVYITNGATHDYPGLVDGVNYRMTNIGTGLLSMLIPLHIPVGATLTEVEVMGYWENQAGAAATLSVDVYKQQNALFAVTAQALGSDTLDDTGVAGAGAAYGAAEVTGLSEVRSNLNGFFAYIQLNNGGETDKLSIVYVQAMYTFDRVVG